MKLVQCSVSLSAIRVLPMHSSEMFSQILFGETAEVLEVEPFFSKIKLNFDGTEGWVMNQHIEEIQLVKSKYIVQNSFLQYKNKKGNFLLSLGAEIDEELENIENNSLQDKLLLTAKSFLSVPYLYGGRSFFGTDASAFVQLVFKVHGISLPRFPREQALTGTVIDFLWESEVGDLAFFEDENGDINHIGIMLSNCEVIHCYGEIRVDALDSSGIYNAELKKHTHKLRFIQRII